MQQSVWDCRKLPHQLFRLTGLDHRIPLARTVDEAREALAASIAPS